MRKGYRRATLDYKERKIHNNKKLHTYLPNGIAFIRDIEYIITNAGRDTYGIYVCKRCRR